MAHIQIDNTEPRVQYTVGGTPSTGPFAIPFAYFADADINVVVTDAAGTDTTYVLTTDFTISGTAVDGGYSGGSITFVSSVSNVTVTIYREIGISRQTDFPSSGPFNIETLNTTLDKLFAIAQELQELNETVIKIPLSDTESVTTTLGNAAARASKYMAFGTDGDVVLTSGTTSPYVISAFMETVLDDADAAAAFTTLGITAFIQTLLDDADAATARATLGLVIGTNVEAFDAAIMKTDEAQTMTAELTVKEVAETVYNFTGTDIDPVNGSVQYVTLSSSPTWTANNFANGQSVTLLIDDGTGNTITWPTISWVGGSQPTLETTDDNVIELWKANGTLYGAFLGAA